jgi:hypothetical protein
MEQRPGLKSLLETTHLELDGKLFVNTQQAPTWHANCRCFDPGGSLDRRVNCRCVPQARWVGARRDTKGGKPRLVLSCTRVGALAVGVTSVREGERKNPARPPSPYEGPGPSFYRCKERVQVYNGGVAIC